MVYKRPIYKLYANSSAKLVVVELKVSAAPVSLDEISPRLIDDLAITENVSNW
jgi:hypothetical protein